MSPQIAILLADIADICLAEALRERGWQCHKVNRFEWERPIAFCLRHGRCASWLCTAVKRGNKLPEFEVEHSRAGDRMIRLRSNPELEAYMQKPNGTP